MGHGFVKIHLKELIEKSPLSKNKIMQRAGMENTQLNRYCKNEVARVDLDVLARLCSVLDCTIADLLEYVPDDPEHKE